MNGSIFTRCACRGEDGKQLGASCPELSKRNHGVRCLVVRLETTKGRIKHRRTVGSAKTTTEKQAKVDLEHISDLVKLASDADTATRVGDLIVAAGSGPLPAVEDVRRRLGLAGDLTGAQTVRDLFEEWFAASSRGWRVTTVKSYRDKLSQHILPVIGDLRLDRLNAGHIEFVFDRIDVRNTAIEAGTAKGKTVGPTTQRHVHGVIRAGLRWAVRQRKLTFDPSSGVTLCRVERVERTVWDADEISTFLAHVADDRLAVMWELFLLRGLRRGEALGLRWSNVDLEARRLRIDSSLLQVSGKVITGTTKTAAGTRWVSLDAETCDALRSHRARQNAERLAWAGAYEDNGLVFAREDGTPVRPDVVSRRFRALAADAGLPGIRLHDTRHSAATLGLAAGIDIKVVSDLLGHSTTAITSNLYSHVLPKMQDDAAERMAGLVTRPKRAVFRAVADPAI